jgi:O-methyltransferase
LRRLVAVATLPDFRYGGIFSQATYSPWQSDADFVQAFAEVKSYTLVDQYRCYELWMLAGQIGELPPGDILEVGVWRGGTGCLIARRCTLDRSSSAVFLCDTFKGVVLAGGHDTAYVGGEHADTAKSVVLDLAGRMALTNVRILEGIFPVDTAEEIEDRTFRFCHIDVDVYESALHTFEWVWPRLVPGGIVVFDDYGFYSCAGVTGLVNEMRGKPDRVVIYNVNGHAVVIKRAGTN